VVSLAGVIGFSVWGNDAVAGASEYNVTYVGLFVSRLGVFAAAILLVRAFVDRWRE
jgi:hypothetical protein